MKRLYFDSVSTQKPQKEIITLYKNLLDKYYVNADSLYDEGLELYNLQERARSNIAKMLGVYNDEIIFTSGSSEANNLAIKGICFKNLKRKHLITSVSEHSSVYNTFKQLEELFNFDVTYLPVNNKGQVELDDLKNAIKEDTLLVSIIYVNNETGAINDIASMAEYVKKNSNAYFHSDMTQALAKVDINLENIDLANFSAHKIGGLKGSGILMRKRYLNLASLITGGQQEFGLRGGTSNVLVNICFAKTLRLALEKHQSSKIKISELKNYLVKKLEMVAKITFNSYDNIYNLVNISTSIKSEIMLNALNKKGIMVSAISTCNSKLAKPSRNLLAMNKSENESLSSIRISLSEDLTFKDIDYLVESIKETINKYETS